MKESQEHQAFAKWLNHNQIPFVHSRTDKRHTNAVGDCDFYCFPAGRVLGIEFKVGRNKLSPAQDKRIAYLRASGIMVHILASASEAISAVQVWAGVENAAGEVPERDLGQPESDVNAGSPPRQKESQSEPAPYVSGSIYATQYIADWGGKPCVFQECEHPWSGKFLRFATQYDLLNISRR